MICPPVAGSYLTVTSSNGYTTLYVLPDASAH
nr:MAG TPA: hypothetical protein [Caudoviricetes sp.]